MRLTTDHLFAGLTVALVCRSPKGGGNRPGGTHGLAPSRVLRGTWPVSRPVAPSLLSCAMTTIRTIRGDVGQLCAFLDRNRGCAHDDIAVADGWVPVKGHFLAAALGSHGSPIVLVLSGCPQCELLGRFQESDAGSRGPHGKASPDKRHCGLARRILLFAVLNQDLLGHVDYDDPVAGKPDDCPANSMLTPRKSQSSTENIRCWENSREPDRFSRTTGLDELLQRHGTSLWKAF